MLTKISFDVKLNEKRVNEYFKEQCYKDKLMYKFFKLHSQN